MTDFQQFFRTRIWRHPTTWIFVGIGAILGGLNMLMIRESKRAAGQAIEMPWLWLERTVDFGFGAAAQAGYFGVAVWLIAGYFEQSNIWIRQGLLLLIYLGIVGLTFVL